MKWKGGKQKAVGQNMFLTGWTCIYSCQYRMVFEIAMIIVKSIVLFVSCESQVLLPSSTKILEVTSRFSKYVLKFFENKNDNMRENVLNENKGTNNPNKRVS